MADVSTGSYNSSGFAAANGTNFLTGELGNYKTDDASLRQQATQQYADTYRIQQNSYETQLSSLIKAQATDADYLNQAYQKSINSMMAKLQKRGLSIGGLPGSTVDALDKFRNDVETLRANIYGQQQAAIQANKNVHANSYEANILQRMNEWRGNNLDKQTKLLQNIAELQSSSMEAYANFLLANQKSSGGGGGGGRSYSSYKKSGSGSSGKSTSKSVTNINKNKLAGNYFTVKNPSNKLTTKKAVTNTAKKIVTKPVVSGSSRISSIAHK